MADVPGKPTAQSFSAGLATEKGLSPMQWNDKCFLCGTGIGETDPRGFYQGKASMMLCHRGCLNIMHTNGGKPEDYHRAMTAQKAAETKGPTWLEFPNLTALQEYTRVHGTIAEGVKVTVAGQTIQG